MQKKKIHYELRKYGKTIFSSNNINRIMYIYTHLNFDRNYKIYKIGQIEKITEVRGA